MRLPTDDHRPKRLAWALTWGTVACLGAYGCQAPQLDRLDGSPTTYLSAGGPVVDNAQPSSQSTAHDAPASQSGGSITKPASVDTAAIDAKLNNGHREAALNHYEQAEACYRSVLDLEPDNAMANHRLAILADRRGDFATSEKCYLKALKREPDNPDLLSDLGYSYLLQGRYAESERCLLAATRLNPLHHKALDNLSLLYAKLGDRDRAFEMLKRSVGETEARVRMAQLFPQARPVAPDDETIVASFAPSSSSHGTGDRNAAVLPQTLASAGQNDKHESQSPAASGWQDSQASSDAAPSSAPVSRGPQATVPTAQSPLEQQLADLMERERQRAVEERAQRQSLGTVMPPTQPALPSQQFSALRLPDPMPQQALRPQPTPSINASSGTVFTPMPIATNRVPDDRINEAFAAIDREGTENSLSATAPADKPAIPQPSPSAAASPSADLKTDLAQGVQAMPVWAAPSPTPPPVSLPPAWQCADGVGPSETPSADPAAAPPTASAPNDLSDWESARSTVPSLASAPAAPAFPTTNANVASPANNTPVPSASIAAAPPSPDAKESWDRDAPLSPPQWTGTAVNTADRTLSSVQSQPDWATESQQQPSPRIVATEVMPAGGSPDWATGRAPRSERQEFATRTQKNDLTIVPGRTASNVAAGSKPPAQQLSREPQTAAKKPAEASNGATSQDAWSLRIQPRHDPPPLFAPNDPSAASRKQPSDKQETFDSGTSWSDVPAWTGAPSSGNPSAERENGPTIRPGSP